MIAWLLACGKPQVDPLAAYREELRAAQGAQLPDDWRPEGQVALGIGPLDGLVTAAISDELVKASKPITLDLLGLQATIVGAPVLDDVALAASTACTSCLTASLSLHGTDTLTLRNATGSMERSQSYRVKAAGTVALELGEDRRGLPTIFARLDAPETWDVQIEVDQIPEVWGAAVSAGVRNGLTNLVASMKVPPLPVAYLKEDGPVPLRGLRVRPLPEAIAVDLAFGVPGVTSMADVAADAPVVVAVPQDTLLGLIRYAALEAKPAEDEPGVVEVRSLDLHEGGAFALGVRLWDLRSRKPRSLDVAVRGTIAVRDGALSIEAEDADLEGPVNPVVWLMRNKILDRVRDSLTATVPAELGDPKGNVLVVIESVTTDGGQLTMRANLHPGP